jgi:hypothetical protein
VLLTVAAKICSLEAFIVALAGLIVTLTGGVTVTTAVADLLASATLVAVTDTLVSEVTLGAVNRPELEIDPCVADHFTETSVVPVTFAVSCWFSVEATLAAVGVIYT